MTFDRADYREYVKEKNGQHFDVNSLMFMRQAEVKAKNLTGVPEWDYFLSYIQAALESSEEQLRQFEALLCSPSLVDHNEILKLKMDIQGVKERIAAWRAVMSLPSDLIEMGEKARGLLDRLGS